MTRGRGRGAPAAFDSSLGRLVGLHFVTRVSSDAPDYAPLVVGSDRWSIQQLATQLGVVNTRAARTISRVVRELQETVKIRHLADLHDKTSPYTFAVEGIAETTYYVLYRAFQSRGLDAAGWAAKGVAEGEAGRSAQAMKKRRRAADALAAANERVEAIRRKRHAIAAQTAEVLAHGKRRKAG